MRISEKARELRADRSLEEIRAREAQLVGNKSAETGDKPEFRTDQIIAVRAGPAPPPEVNASAEKVITDALTERAALRKVGEVIQTEPKPEVDPVADARADARAEAHGERPPVHVMGSGSAGPANGPEGAHPQAEPVSLPGSGGSAPAFEPMGSGGPPESTPAARSARPSGTADAPPAPKPLGSGDGPAEARVEDRGSLDDAAAVAPLTGQVQGAEPQRRDADVELPGGRPAEQADPVAERVFSRGGAVTAQSESDILTRFVSHDAPPDPGPTPAPREHLGERPR